MKNNFLRQRLGPSNGGNATLACRAWIRPVNPWRNAKYTKLICTTMAIFFPGLQETAQCRPPIPPEHQCLFDAHPYVATPLRHLAACQRRSCRQCRHQAPPHAKRADRQRRCGGRASSSAAATAPASSSTSANLSIDNPTVHTLDLYALYKLTPAIQLRLSGFNLRHQDKLTTLNFTDGSGTVARYTADPSMSGVRAALEGKFCVAGRWHADAPHAPTREQGVPCRCARMPVLAAHVVAGRLFFLACRAVRPHCGHADQVRVHHKNI